MCERRAGGSFDTQGKSNPYISFSHQTDILLVDLLKSVSFQVFHLPANFHWTRDLCRLLSRPQLGSSTSFHSSKSSVAAEGSLPGVAVVLEPGWNRAASLGLGALRCAAWSSTVQLLGECQLP